MSTLCLSDPGKRKGSHPGKEIHMNYRPAPERHTFEHVSFPCAFYEYGKQILEHARKEKSSYLMHLYNDGTSEGKHKPFRSSEFAVLSKTCVTDGSIKNILRLTLPKPQRTLECRYIYLCHKPSTGDILYFTSELSAQGGYYLCAWTKDHSHLLLNMDADKNELDFIAESFDELAGFDPGSLLPAAI